ncbi:Auxin-responsive protein [Quillaja saponaria]|uniref:Auxin-induced protein n=1 Tax=Quillaja saponaria TaxID=32244 RepID=A0AAD7PKA8_QUISA|nr:Auxin-responsive protein [Quillaja saponaria]
MELNLGLTLSSHSPIKGFDLNKHGWNCDGCLESKNYVKNKRNFEEAFGKNGGTIQSLPLLVWSGQPNEEDDQSGQKNRTSFTTNKNKEEENHWVVGWPPIESWRKKQLHKHQGGQNNNDRIRIPLPAQNELPSGGTGSNSLYVKVKMEGVAITRKINLRLFNSYLTLTNTLISMFAKYQKCDKYEASYTLTYQDTGGDWLLAGDVPWQSFIDSVQRLEMLRNENQTA